MCPEPDLLNGNSNSIYGDGHGLLRQNAMPEDNDESWLYPARFRDEIVEIAPEVVELLSKLIGASRETVTLLIHKFEEIGLLDSQAGRTAATGPGGALPDPSIRSGVRLCFSVRFEEESNILLLCFAGSLRMRTDLGPYIR